MPEEKVRPGFTKPEDAHCDACGSAELSRRYISKGVVADAVKGGSSVDAGWFKIENGQAVAQIDVLLLTCEICGCCAANRTLHDIRANAPDPELTPDVSGVSDNGESKASSPPFNDLMLVLGLMLAAVGAVDVLAYFTNMQAKTALPLCQLVLTLGLMFLVMWRPLHIRTF